MWMMRHPSNGPPDKTASLWRYVSFERFEQLLHERALWFISEPGSCRSTTSP
jgi:hypothetical protein